MVQQWLAPPKKHQESLYYQNQTMNYASKKEKKHQMMYQKKMHQIFDPPPKKKMGPNELSRLSIWFPHLGPSHYRQPHSDAHLGRGGGGASSDATGKRWYILPLDPKCPWKMKVLNPKNRVFPTIGGKPPKWMVKIMENPIKMDDLGGKPTILGNPQYMG